MDIRIATYRPNVTVSTVAQPGNPLAMAYVQNANQNGPVSAAGKIAENPGGYTDSVRGSLVNILA